MQRHVGNKTFWHTQQRFINCFDWIRFRLFCVPWSTLHSSYPSCLNSQEEMLQPLSHKLRSLSCFCKLRNTVFGQSHEFYVFKYIWYIAFIFLLFIKIYLCIIHCTWISWTINIIHMYLFGISKFIGISLWLRTEIVNSASLIAYKKSTVSALYFSLCFSVFK